jgi:23S rRNA (adenine2503-C2)-methyltransferase
MDSRPNLFGLGRAQLADLLGGLGEPAYRAGQVFRWLYGRRVRALDEMSDLPLSLRQRLKASHRLSWPEVVERHRSGDGTVKSLFRLDDGGSIEAVFIPESKRRTICISTQAGCPLACAFCLTGIGGYTRNLSSGEILGQVATVMEEAGEEGAEHRPWNVVVMGMGEPLLNYEATVQALRVLMDPEGFALAPRRLTLSTVGILPALEKLMLEPVRPNLAISLHASNPSLRATLMPIERRYALADVVEAALRYPVPRGGRVTFEYVLLRGVNDAPSHARELARLLAGRHCKVNLIPLNAAPEIPFAPPTEEAVEAFCRVLTEARVPVSVRRSRGQDIQAACGQLKLHRGAALPQPVS